ncbi:SET [Rhynchobatus djiddensis adomavirus 1]|uniref:SET n=1 Tax=Rhynchobatus djiddensis adomavirus 1 TaxID=2175117 RepID=A0A2S1MK36_9VIRU|nr:SET [Rhynchobatus djiddensis adomavirus 1]AWG87395.1 SET [Rhynchobatus djiddensis adomavirus 1]
MGERRKEILNEITTRSWKEKVVVKLSEINGYGLFAKVNIKKGELVCEYEGECITESEARDREIQYAEEQSACVLLYFYAHGLGKRVIDPTATESESKRINHCINPNLIPRVYLTDQQPRVVFLANEHIAEGAELFFNYFAGEKKAAYSEISWANYKRVSTYHIYFLNLTLKLCSR